MLLLGVLLPLVMTGVGGGESNRFPSQRPVKDATLPDILPLSRDAPAGAGGTQRRLRTAARSALAGGILVSPPYNISAAEATWPLAQVIVVRHGVSDLATERDVMERANEVLNASGNPDSPLPFQKDERRGDLQYGERHGAAEPTTMDDRVVSVHQLPPQKFTDNVSSPDIPPDSVPAHHYAEPPEECTKQDHRRNKRRPSGLGFQTVERQRVTARKSSMWPGKTSRSVLRKVKVVLSRANRNNRITTMPPTSLPLLPVPPLADREDLDDKLTLHERGCLPLETSPAVQDRSTCPFRFLTSFDRRRLPRLVTTVRCMCPGSTCSKRRGYRCLEVNRPMTVMRRVGRVYVDKVEDMPVACVCAYVGRKSRGRRP